MTKARRGGFTLIELLTVIAIIGVLTAITLPALSRARERARMARMTANLDQIHTALVTYYTEYGSYPPAYGYLKWDARGLAPEQLVPGHYNNIPWMAQIGMTDAEGIYDEFGSTYDSNQDGIIQHFEFEPIPFKPSPVDPPVYDDEIYQVHNAFPDTVQQLMNMSPRPYIYVPVNLDNADRAKKYFYNNDLLYAEAWDWNNPYINRMQFPPPRYDAYVLIGMGPNENTFGIVTPPPLANVPPELAYHVQAHRIYFLATRDANQSGRLDFSFEARTQGEGRVPGNELPYTDMPNGAGPVIFTGR